MIERLVAPLHVSEKPLPPHDLEMYDNTSRVIARWDGDLLDELGTRDQMTANLNAVVAAFDAMKRLRDLVEFGQTPCFNGTAHAIVGEEATKAVIEADAVADWGSA